MRAKLAIRGTFQKPEIGLFKKQTHDVISIPDCPLHHPSILKAYAILKEAIIEIQIPPYDEKKQTGTLRYVQFLVENMSQKVQLALAIHAHEKTPPIEKLIAKISKDPLFSGIWLNYQKEATNQIFGQKWEHVHGNLYAIEKLNGISFFFHPACFSQAHLALFEKILQSIRSSLLKGKRVLDLYSGVGVIGLSVANLCSSVVCSEITSFAKECFELSRSYLDPSLQATFVLGSSQSLLHLLDSTDVLLVDPPRKGLDPSLLDKIAATSSISQIIYVSCYFPSFQRDCQKLIEMGWKIKKAEGYLLFPGTDQVETLCVFEKS
ncbi:MAG: class I SAM-dependent RNA methyltransferase [Chlamydiales bacterium]|nr:class I SAM-dependent RNA methyltransferase [Chlamydiales bacterium]